MGFGEMVCSTAVRKGKITTSPRSWQKSSIPRAGPAGGEKVSGPSPSARLSAKDLSEA